MVLGEIVSAAGFSRDHLYLEYQMSYDPDLWILQTPQSQDEPGTLKVKHKHTDFT